MTLKANNSSIVGRNLMPSLSKWTVYSGSPTYDASTGIYTLPNSSGIRSPLVSTRTAPGYLDLIINHGATAYYRLSESSGNPADFTHNGNDLTWSAAPTYAVTGVTNDADTGVTISGTQRASAITPTLLAYSTGTVEAWIKTTTGVDSTFRGVIVKQDAYAMFVLDGHLVAYDWTASAVRDSGVSVNDGNWHHVAYVFESGVTNGSQLYVDGSVAGSAFTMTVSAQGAPFLLGEGNTGAQYFIGTLDECAVYPMKLSASQIASHAANPTTKTELLTTAERNHEPNAVSGSTWVANEAGSGSGVTLADDTAEFHTGSASVRATVPGTGYGAAYTNGTHAALPSTDYDVSIWLKRNTGTQPMTLSLYCYDAAGFIGTVNSDTSDFAITSSWVRYTGTLTTIANTAFVRLAVATTGDGSSQSWWQDDATLLASPPYTSVYGNWVIKADFWTDTISSEPTFQPNGGMLWTTVYYKADGTSAAFNSGPYSSNGNAQSLVIGAWTRKEWAYLSDNEVVYVRWVISNDGFFVGGTLKVQNCDAYLYTSVDTSSSTHLPNGSALRVSSKVRFSA